jgi:hypothetical protein
MSPHSPGCQVYNIGRPYAVAFLDHIWERIRSLPARDILT